VLNNNPPKFEKAIGILKQGYKLNRWQIGVKSQVSAQIGMILFLKKDNKEAAEYLNESKELAHWMAAAMLGVIYFKQKKYDEMKSAFEVAVKKSSKETLAWSLYAYCLEDLGKRDEAMAILNRGIKKVKDHQKLDENLLALQNNKKMKMRQLYKEQWYQFQIEKPPAIVMENQFQSFSKKRRRHIQ
jgi:tetratricopeptide (TPR) repeat protein